MVYKERLRRETAQRTGRPIMNPLNSLGKKIMAWSRAAAVVVMRSDWIMSIF